MLNTKFRIEASLDPRGKTGLRMLCLLDAIVRRIATGFRVEGSSFSLSDLALFRLMVRMLVRSGAIVAAAC